MKVIISCGLGKLHFHEVVRAAALSGAEVEFIVGWVPSEGSRRLVNLLGRLIGETSLSKRLQARVVHHPRVTVRSVAAAEVTGRAAERLLHRFFSPGQLSGFAFGLCGAASRRWLHNADIFHVRSGAGQGGAIQAARGNGMLILADHSIAHPVYMDDVLQGEYDRLNLPFSRTANDSLWSKVLRDCDEADQILVNSDFVKRTFVQNGVPQQKIAVAYWGVQEAFYSAKQNYRIDGPIRLLFTGNFEIRKGVATLLDSIRGLRRGGLDVRLRLIGNLGNGGFLLRASDAEFFTHTPFVLPTDLIPALSDSDIFVFPTLIEGCSRAAMEAAAAGLPVITTESCGLPLEHGKEVIYTQQSNSDALANAIAHLASDEPLRHSIGQSATNRIQASYNWITYGDQLQKIYAKLLQ